MKVKNNLLQAAFCLTLSGVASCGQQPKKQASYSNSFQNSICKSEDVKGPVHTIQISRFVSLVDGQASDTTFQTMFVFNREGYLTDIMQHSANGQWKSDNTYDSVRRIFSDHSVNAAGERISTVESYYDTAGNEVCRKSYQSGAATNQPDYMERYLYDKNNNLTARYYYKDGQNLTDKTTYEFNKANQEVKSIDYENELPTTYTLNVYDSKGNRIEENTYESGKLHHINRISYDEHDNPVEEQSIYPDRNLTLSGTYTYRYDNRGNWIEQKTTNHEQKQFINRRSITYY